MQNKFPRTGDPEFTEKYRLWQTELYQNGPFTRIYAPIMRSLARPFYDWVIETTKVDLKQSHHICDVGAGSGILAREISRHMHGKEFTLVDRSVAHLASGQSSTIRKANQINAVTVVESQAESMPLQDNQFDLVISVTSINLWEDPVAGLRESLRICKPGGVLWQIDHEPCETWPWFYDAVFRKRIFGIGTPGYSQDEILSFAEQAGFPVAAAVIRSKSFYAIRWVKPA